MPYSKKKIPNNAARFYCGSKQKRLRNENIRNRLVIMPSATVWVSMYVAMIVPECVCVCLGGIFMPQRSAWHNKQWKNNIVSSVAANLAHLRVSFERWKRKQNLHIKTKTQMN